MTKKPARELTNKEAIERLFPKRAVKELDKEAHKHDDGEKPLKKAAKKHK